MLVISMLLENSFQICLCCLYSSFSQHYGLVFGLCSSVTPRINSFIEFIRNVLTWQPGADARGARVPTQLQIFAHIILVFQLNLRVLWDSPASQLGEKNS